MLGSMQLGANLMTLALAAVSTLTYYVCWRWFETTRARGTAKSERAGISSLPSPKAVLPRWLPFLGGHTLQMDPEKLNLQLEGWAHEFGGDYELTVIGKRIVHVTGVADMRRILRLRPTKFKRGWMPNQMSWVARRVGMHPFIFFDEGEQWGRSRRIVSPAFQGHQNVANMIPTVAKIANLVCSNLDDQDGMVVELSHMFECFAHDVIARVAFGFDADSVGSNNDRPSSSLEGMRMINFAFVRLASDPLSIFGWTMMPALVPWVGATKSSVRKLLQVVEVAISNMRQKIKEEGGKTPFENEGGFLRKVLSCWGDGDGSKKAVDNRMKIPNSDVLPQVVGLFFAGTDTTAKTLSWATYFLAKHPEMLTRCREEALRVAPHSGGVVSTAEQASQLVFCSAVFKETLRLWPPVRFLSFYSTEPTTLESGKEFEAGTAYTLLLRYPCLSEESFTRAKDFVPERWIEAERELALLGERSTGDKSRRDVVHHGEVVQVFGGGPRKCPGESLSNLEGPMLLAAICARFDLALAPGQADPPEQVMTITVGVKSLRVVVTKKKT